MPLCSETLLKQLLDGQPAALARAISLAENDLHGREELLAGVPGDSHTTPLVGFTGAPGVGKSSLINAYTKFCREHNRRVAILSVDPSSPISGGAILGDRLRMAEHSSDDGVFIRSLASRGHLGGLCDNITDIIRLVEAAGWDVIVLETVGAGQSEIELASIADIKIVISAPGMGDAIQAMKAGILEIADILVVNKSDLPDAGQTSRDLLAMLRLRPKSRSEVAVIKTVATRHVGINELSAAIDGCFNSMYRG